MKHGPKTLLAFQALAHASLVYLLFVGHWWQFGVVALVYFFNGCLGMTMTYHRLLSHSGYPAPRWFQIFGTLCATVGLTGSAISWVSIHREHHRYMDTDKDPHAPRFKGWWYTHFFSMFIKVHPKYSADLLRDRFFLLQHKYYYVINLAYAAALFAIDPFAIVYAWLAPAAVLWNAGSSIVSFSHRHGRPSNDLWLALLVWGEGYHTNHHDEPRNPVFGKWDLGGWLIRMAFLPGRMLSQKSSL
jgi:stearoyl-CoA desaturase (delta-9 desaturase)